MATDSSRDRWASCRRSCSPRSAPAPFQVTATAAAAAEGTTTPEVPRTTLVHTVAMGEDLGAEGPRTKVSKVSTKRCPAVLSPRASGRRGGGGLCLAARPEIPSRGVGGALAVRRDPQRPPFPLPSLRRWIFLAVQLQLPRLRPKLQRPPQLLPGVARRLRQKRSQHELPVQIKQPLPPWVWSFVTSCTCAPFEYSVLLHHSKHVNPPLPCPPPPVSMLQCSL